MRKLYFLIVPACILISCSKSKSNEDAAQKKADEFQATIKTKKYKPIAFYSDKPIDYITTDAEVRSETDLWGYVKDYIKDDVDLFNDNGTVTIYQNTVKIPLNDAPEINVSYGCAAVSGVAVLNFVDYNYAPLQYKLEQFDGSSFIVYVDGPSGSKLFSKFARVE